MIKVQNVSYEDVVQLVRNNMASIMEDPYYDGYDIEVTSEMQFLKKKEAYKNRIYMVVKFSPAIATPFEGMPLKATTFCSYTLPWYTS